MRTWLKKFEMWERIIHEKSNRTGERIDGTVPSRRQDEDGVSAKQLRQLNLDGTVDVLAEELIFGTTKSQTQTRWSSLSDDDLIHEVIGRPSSFTPMVSNKTVRLMENFSISHRRRHSNIKWIWRIRK